MFFLFFLLFNNRIVSHASETNIEINKMNFPDATFRNLILEYVDDNKDGFLSCDEASDIKRMYLQREGITSLKGVEYFTELVFLDCDRNELTELDVSNCKKLVCLECSGNGLTKLDISGCKELVSILCGENQLSDLDVSVCPGLIELYCYNNALTALDLHDFKSLKELVCSENKLEKLNVSGCSALEKFYCHDNIRIR